VTQHRELEPVVAPDVATEEDTHVPEPASLSRWSERRNALALYAAVALGSVIGAVLRALVSLAFQDQFVPGFPLGTLFANVSGSFVIGFYATLTAPDGRLFAGPHQRQFVMTGICGGYTTFSIFSLETFRFLHAGHVIAAGLNVGISIISWLAAVWLGHVLAAYLNRLRRS
jgi:CrcB protein